MGKKPKKEEEFTEEYRKKRDRNNQAVKRSRVKSKQKTEQTMVRVNHLKDKNKRLEAKIEMLKDDLKFLKGIFMDQVASKADKIDSEELRRVLADNDSDNEDDDTATSSAAN